MRSTGKPRTQSASKANSRRTFHRAAWRSAVPRAGRANSPPRSIREACRELTPPPDLSLRGRSHNLPTTLRMSLPPWSVRNPPCADGRTPCAGLALPAVPVGGPGERHDSRAGRSRLAAAGQMAVVRAVHAARTDCAALVAQGRVRINRQPTDKPHARLRIGDVLTVPLRGEVRVVRVWRWPPGVARPPRLAAVRRGRGTGPGHLARGRKRRHIAGL